MEPLCRSIAKRSASNAGFGGIRFIMSKSSFHVCRGTKSSGCDRTLSHRPAFEDKRSALMLLGARPLHDSAAYWILRRWMTVRRYGVWGKLKVVETPATWGREPDGIRRLFNLAAYEGQQTSP